MRRIRDPQQTRLFDPFDGVLSNMARKRLLQGWQGVVRAVVLKLLPVEKLAEHFSPDNGAPTKELYSMAGLVFLADFFGWDAITAADNYMLNVGVQFALNLEPGAELSSRTIERYRELFQDDEAAQKVFFAVTAQLVELLGQDVSKQRLDSTHVCSHMATFGRVKLMAVTLKRALTQIKRHERALFDELPLELRARYEPSQGQLFAGLKDEEARQRSRQQVAEDMFAVIVKFSDVATINGRSSFQMLLRVFDEQVEVLEECVLVRKSTGGNVVQNPSDAGATYDGHKGAGYQMQLSETCSEQNDVQLVVGAIPETAAAEDGDALPTMLEQLHEHDRLPEELLADTAYGSDANVQAAEAVGVDLVAPVRGRAPQASADELTLDDFAHHEETGAVDACPQSHAPLSVTRDEVVTTTPSGDVIKTTVTTVTMSAEHCGSCPLSKQCPIKRQRDGSYELKFTDKDRRLAARRREESTDVFAERYALRAGIESLNSGVKNRLGMKRLPVRGKGAVFRVMMNKVTGWNILRAATTDKLRAWVSEEVKKLLGSNWAGSCGQLGHVIEPSQRALRAFQTLSPATSSPPPRLAA
jgi:Transposase DDE domain